jgi:hypothetical protein
MNHDLDDALRDSMRRHAEDAPTSIDTDGIRLRARTIQRRRTLESVAAVVVLLGVVLGLGAVVGTLRNDATPPPAVTQTPVPGSGPLMAFTASKDGNTPLGIVVRAGGTDTVVTSASDFNGGLTLVGWYGPDQRTLVWGVAGDGLRAATLYAVTIGADGRPADSPHPLRVPGLPDLGRGVAFPVAGADRPIQFWVPSDPSGMRGTSTLVTIAPDLASGLSRPLPNGLPVSANLDAPGPLVPVSITDAYAVLVGIDSGRVGVSTLTAEGATHPAKTSACTPRVAEATNLQGVVALGCSDGSVDLLTPDDGNVTHLGLMPEAADPGRILGLWWDPSGGLHASTTPVAQADYTVVHDWGWTGKAWVRSSDEGVITRLYPVGSPSVRLVKKNDLPGNLGRWIVESNPEVDLGPTDGALVVAPVTSQPTTVPLPPGSSGPAASG